MSDSKKYYWLKLNQGFFEDDTIQWLEEQTNGKDYVIFYLKLCLKSLNDNGYLIRYVGERLIPYDVHALSKLTSTSADTVAIAMNLFIEIGLVKRLESGEIFMSQLNEMIGTETDSAVRMRKKRVIDRAQLDIKQLPSHCDTDVRKCDTEIEIEREIELDKEIEKELDKELERQNKKPVRHKNGEFNNVLLTDEQMTKDVLSESILKKLKNRNLRNLRNDTEETKESITVDNTVNHNSINMCRGKAESIYESYIKNRKTEKNKTINRIQSLIKKHGEEKIIRAVERYKEETKDTEIQFIKMSSGFFTDDYIGRFIEDDYEPPKKKGQPEEEIRNYRILK